MKRSEASAINHSITQVINMQYVKIVFCIREEMCGEINRLFMNVSSLCQRAEKRRNMQSFPPGRYLRWKRSYTYKPKR